MFFKKILFFLDKLSLRPKVGGLEINDSAVRFLQIDGEKTLTVSVDLKPGVIADGKIKDRQNFLEALQNIRSQIENNSSKKIHAVVSLPPSLVFAQSFSVPQVNVDQLEETVKFNLQFISPLELEKAYYDWQIIGEKTDHKEILGTFVEKTAVEEYELCLREGGFLPAAFEFPSLALCRSIKKSVVSLDADKFYLAVAVLSDGLSFFVFKNKELRFNRFLSWRFLQGEKREISFSDFSDFFSREVKKIINFSFTQLKEDLREAIVIAPVLEKEIGELLQKEFNLKLVALDLKNCGDLTAVWLTVFGSALRGLVSRREDAEISLTQYDVMEEFYHEQTLSFIVLWRNIIVTTLLILLAVFAGSDVFCRRLAKNVKSQIDSLTVQPQTQQFEQLQNRAILFNQTVAVVAAAKNSIQNWSPFFQRLNESADPRIVLEYIAVQTGELPARIRGNAESEQAAVDFKNTLQEKLNIEKIDLPINQFKILSDRRVGFEISFFVKRQ